MDEISTSTARHPIGVVSARTGLPQDLIRAWERRYQAVTPQRAGTGRRLYTDADVERLRLLRRAVAAGRRISDVANLPDDRLKALISEDRAEAGPAAPTRVVSDNSAREIIAESMEALEALDRPRLEKLLDSARVTMSGPMLRQELVVPLLNVIGDRWRDGSLRIVHEHLASAIVKSFVSTLRNTHHPNAPTVVVTTPSGQLHELGALLAASAADESGWNALYLGPNLPAEEVAAAVRQIDAAAVALSFVYAENDASLLDEIRRLMDYIDPVPVIAGGRRAEVLGAELEALGVKVVGDLTSFQDALMALER